MNSHVQALLIHICRLGFLLTIFLTEKIRGARIAADKK